MNAQRLLTILSASALAVAPIAANAAAPLSIASHDMRAGPDMRDGSQLNGGTGIALGLLVLVAIIAVAVTSGDDDGGTPASP